MILFNIQIYKRPLWSEIVTFGRLTTTNLLGENSFFYIVVPARLISFFKFGRTTNLLGDTVRGESFWTVFSYYGSFDIFIQLSHINHLKVAGWQAIWRMIQRYCCSWSMQLSFHCPSLLQVGVFFCCNCTPPLQKHPKKCCLWVRVVLIWFLLQWPPTIVQILGIS